MRDTRLGPPRLLHLPDRAAGSRAACSTADFRVHGTRGLRVVDASVFPRIPGFFIASAVYMIGEKAADDDPRPRASSLTAADRLSAVREEATDHGLRRPTAPDDVAEASSTTCSPRARRATSPTARPRAPRSSRRARPTARTSPRSSTTSRWQGKVFDGEKGVLKNRILPFGVKAIIAKVYKDDELARRQGVHRPRLLRHLARRAVDPRRDPPDRARALPRQGLLGQEAADRLRPEVLIEP